MLSYRLSQHIKLEACFCEKETSYVRSRWVYKQWFAQSVKCEVCPEERGVVEQCFLKDFPGISTLKHDLSVKSGQLMWGLDWVWEN